MFELLHSTSGTRVHTNRYYSMMKDQHEKRFNSWYTRVLDETSFIDRDNWTRTKISHRVFLVGHNEFHKVITTIKQVINGEKFIDRTEQIWVNFGENQKPIDRDEFWLTYHAMLKDSDNRGIEPESNYYGSDINALWKLDFNFHGYNYSMVSDAIVNTDVFIKTKLS